MVEKPQRERKNPLSVLAGSENRILNPIVGNQNALASSSEKNEYAEIPLSHIKEVYNIRKRYDETSIQEMADSISEHGVLQPIFVYKRGPENYLIIWGHRRYLGSKKANKTTIRAYITLVEPKNIIVTQLVENIQREDLSPSEVENSVMELSLTMDLQQICITTGKSKSWLSRVMASAKYRAQYKDILEKYNCYDSLAASVLVQLTPVPEEQRIEVLERAINEGGSRRVFQAVAQEVVQTGNKKNEQSGSGTENKKKGSENSVSLKFLLIDECIKIDATKKGSFAEDLSNDLITACKDVMKSHGIEVN